MFFFQYSNKSISYNDRDLVATSKSGYSRLPFSYVPGQMRYIIFPASPGSAPGLQNMHGPFFFNFQRATFRWEHMINIYWWKKRCYVQLNTWHKVRLCNGHRHYLSALDVQDILGHFVKWTENELIFILSVFPISMLLLRKEKNPHLGCLWIRYIKDVCISLC